MKLESLVIADQHVAVNTFPGLVHTARHTMGVGSARKRWPNEIRTERPEPRTQIVTLKGNHLSSVIWCLGSDLDGAG